MIGNRAVQRMLQAGAHERETGTTGPAAGRVRSGDARAGRPAAPEGMQAKLTINTPGDVYEQEAERVSEQIMRMPEPRVQRACGCSGASHAAGECADCAKKRLSVQRVTMDGAGPVAADAAPSIVHDVLRAPARPLDAAVRADMERHFGYDFGRVRIHAGRDASAATDAVQAQAFTVGSDIVFGSSRFAPSTTAGRKLLAHELTHVVQQGAAPAPAAHAPARTDDLAAEAPAPQRLSAHDSRLQRRPKGDTRAAPADACPPMERNEREEAAKATLQMVETIPQQEWLIFGFPIGGTAVPSADASRFISAIVRSLMQGHFIYVTGQDPVEVVGFSDCFAGPRVDNRAIRQSRAANFCAEVQDHYAATPKTYPSLIRSCGPAPMDEFVASNATRAERAQNRSVVVRRVAAAKFQYQEGNQTFPYNPKYGPSAAHCAAYTTPQARDILGRVYTNNAHCSCMVTPDEPHNNCVRDCLQQKMWNLLANQVGGRKPGDPPMDINAACLLIWKHHRECYHDCGCASEFIDYLAFDAVCNIALPCAIDSAAINLMNRCMPATKDDKYQPVK